MTFSPLRCVGQPFQMTAIVSPCTTVCALRWITLVHLEHPDLVLFKVTVHGAWKNIPQIIKILPKKKKKNHLHFILHHSVKIFYVCAFLLFCTYSSSLYSSSVGYLFLMSLLFFSLTTAELGLYMYNDNKKLYFFLFYSITKAYLSKFYLVFWGNKFA